MKNEDFMKELSRDVVRAFAPTLYPYIVAAFSSMAILVVLQLVILFVLILKK